MLRTRSHTCDIPESLWYLKRIMPEDVEGLGTVFHGTTRKASVEIESPENDFLLRKMGRNFLHFFSTNEMASSNMKIENIKGSAREYCFVFVGIKKWLELGHKLWIALNGVVLSDEDVRTYIWEGNRTVDILKGSTRFPIVMRYHKRWHPEFRGSQESSTNISRPSQMPPKAGYHQPGGSSAPMTPPKAAPKFKAPPLNIFPPKARTSSTGPSTSSASDSCPKPPPQQALRRPPHRRETILGDHDPRKCPQVSHFDSRILHKVRRSGWSQVALVTGSVKHAQTAYSPLWKPEMNSGTKSRAHIFGIH